MSRFKNKQLYTDVFPLSRVGLVGTEYQYNKVQPAQTSQTIQTTKQKFGEPIISTKNQRFKTVSTETQPIQDDLKIKYDPSLHYTTPKSELDLPLYVALRMTYPNQLDKYKTKAEKYGYYVDTDLNDKEHLVLVNPKKNITVFGVKGTDPTSSIDLATDAVLAYSDIKSELRYKKAVSKYEKIKEKYPQNELIRVGHSLGGLIQSEMSLPTEKTYTYNRPYFNYPVKPNEIAISVESDPLLNTYFSSGSVRGMKQKPSNIKIIPRTYYRKAQDYVGIQKAKVNPLYEEIPIEIPKEYKTDLPNTLLTNAYEGYLAGVYTGLNVLSRPKVRDVGRIVNSLTTASSRVNPNYMNPETMNNLQNYIGTLSNPSFLTRVGQKVSNLNTPYSPIIFHGISKYVATPIKARAEDSHAIENLPLSIRIEPSKKK